MKMNKYPKGVTDETEELVRRLSALARTTIGPEGTVMRVADEADARLVRATFIAKVADGAISMANGDEL